MLRALLALGLILSSLAEARELQLKKKFDHRWDTRNWSVALHRAAGGKGDQLIALNRDYLSIEILNPATGETIGQDSLDTRARRPRLIETLSARSGEFVVAIATNGNKVELHVVGRDESFEVTADALPQGLALAEGEQGEIFLAVTTQQAVEVYRRLGSELDLVQRLGSQSGVASAKLMRTSHNDMLLEIFDGARKSHLLQLNAEGTDFGQLITKAHPAKRVDGAIGDGDDYLIAALDGRNMRFYIESQKMDTATVPADLNLGSAGWLKSPDGRRLFTAVHRERKGRAAFLSVYDPYNVATPVAKLGTGDARLISDVGAFKIGRQMFYFWVKDRKNLVIQNENVTLMTPNSGKERIAGVQHIRGTRRLAVMLESDTAARLLMVEIR